MNSVTYSNVNFICTLFAARQLCVCYVCYAFPPIVTKQLEYKYERHVNWTHDRQSVSMICDSEVPEVRGRPKSAC